MAMKERKNPIRKCSDEFDRIEAQFDALEEGGETDSPDAGAASRADTDDSDEDDEDGYDEAEASTELKTPDDALGWTAEDSADMLDEEDEFPARTAIEALVDATRIAVVPLTVDTPPLDRASAAASGRVGRTLASRAGGDGEVST